ncbi:MAG: GSCFA domain-containing protein [Flavobacterium sp.]|nr:GSCFA domain-containing protein [Flavobacterium sp.]
MQFRTQVPLHKNEIEIDYHSKIVLLGSCFAENMGEKFEYYKFKSTVNPFGIIFNPVSLAKIIEKSVQKNYFTEADIFFHNDLWHCFEVHSELSNLNKEIFLKTINELIDSTNKQLNDSTHIIITLGTSWVYRNMNSKEIVANCHKVPQKEFKKELLTIDKIEESLATIISLINTVNPNCKFIFTVSPVRHVKDGFVENTLSKSHLIAAIHSVLNQKFSTSLELTTSNQKQKNNKLSTITHNPSYNTYFPAYEIMMDELRDYRFYTEDMLHPNQTAVNYIWDCFCSTSVTTASCKMMKEIETIQKGLAHRPFNPETESHKKFLTHLKSKILKIEQDFPQISFGQ